MRYRWNVSRDIPLLFPFGHGLSNTTFEFGEPTLSVQDSGASHELDLHVRVTVANTGGRSGSEIDQCYVEPPVGLDQRPAWKFRAFERVTLGPGESTEVVLTLGFRCFARWVPAVPGLARVTEQLPTVRGPDFPQPAGRPEGHSYVDPGTYRIHLGRSVTDLVCDRARPDQYGLLSRRAD